MTAGVCSNGGSYSGGWYMYVEKTDKYMNAYLHVGCWWLWLLLLLLIAVMFVFVITAPNKVCMLAINYSSYVLICM